MDSAKKFLTHIDRENVNRSKEILSKLPSSIKSQFEKLICQTSSTKPKPADNSIYYNPPASELSTGNIVFVDTKEKFQSFLDDFEVIKENVNDVIGLDCEWKPSFSIVDESDTTVGNNVNGASIFQIATRNMTYIVDMFFVQNLETEVINMFASRILYRQGVIKLGELILAIDFSDVSDHWRSSIRACINFKSKIK
jgi:hypothetical protein